MSTSVQIHFHTIDVFTRRRFRGNPLAIILVDRSLTLSQEQKQLVAREFNLSETVFIHGVESSEDPESSFTIDIFTTAEELPFAGHPTVGAGWLLSQLFPGREAFTLSTKAGKIPVAKLPTTGVRLQVPIDFKEHTPYHFPQLKTKGRQPHLEAADYVTGIDGADPVASIVKGMSFMLLQLTSEDSLAKFQAFSSPVRIPNEHLGAWSGFSSLYIFVVLADGVTVRTRMFEGTFEDPATGSAASTLCGWLGKQKGPGSWEFNVIQGVEMGRESRIGVSVAVGINGEVERIDLAGDAVKVMEGTIDIELS
ncbi:Diaminopimelate epimerase-like protein [Gymnopus androsaceus JB14]|uniref:Diaminopimelate epimerase-like protein n=1 Tax=Gymnopus androsaceus JB14 TaxID=1447944 RepID=A0A6A4H7P1_9AGAR|nr:Diaminopimelate epimerase-like protein [Gymnopus androsaceus JB14]